MSYRKLMFVTLLGLAVGQSFSQKLWSIEECIDWALEHNISLKQSQVRVEQGMISKKSAEWAYAPSLSANTGYNINTGRSLDQTTYTYTNNTAQANNTSINLSTQVFAGMKKMYNLQKTKLDLQAAIANKEDLQMDISIQVASAYLQVLYNKEQIKNGSAQLESTRSQLEKIRKLVDAGSQPLSAQLEIEAQIAQEDYNLVTYKSALATNTLTLRQLMELPTEVEFDIVVPDISNLDSIQVASVQEVNSYAQEYLPSVRAASYQLESAQKTLKIAQAGYYPIISFSANANTSWNSTREKLGIDAEGNITREYYPYFEQFYDNRNGSLSLNLSIPIFTSLNQRFQVQNSRWNLTNAGLSLATVRNNLHKKIQQAYTDAVGSLEQYHSAEKSVTSLQASFDITSQKFSVGAATSTDYIQSKNNLTNAENTLIQAKYTYLFRTKILNYYKGEPLKF